MDLTTSMAHRNTAGTYQMLPIKQDEGYDSPVPNRYAPVDSTDYYPNSNNYQVMPIVQQTQEQGDGHIYPPSGNSSNYPNQYAYPPMHASRNVADSNLPQLVYDHGRHAEDQGQSSRNKFYHHVSDVGPSVPTPCMDFIPHNGFSEQFAPGTHVDAGIVPNDSSSHHNAADSEIIHRRRKHPEMYVGKYSSTNEPTYPNLSSGNIYQNSEQLRRVVSNGEIHPTNQNAFTSQSYIGSETFPERNSFGWTSISSSSAINFPPEGGFSHENSMCEHLHPSSVFWVDRHGSYNWNPPWGISSNNGGWLYSEAAESRNMNLQEYPRASINRNSSTVHPSAYFNHHQRVLPALDVQVHPYNQHAHVTSPSYGMPPSNHNQHMDSTSRSSGSFRSVAAAAEFFIYPEALCFGDSEDEDDGSDSDYWHYDMPLDVDHMSYEELLDLEEYMGDVCTGLSEDLIMKNLKILVWAPQWSLSLSDIFESSDETCAICLEKYQEFEKIGSLDCDHSYHVDCIKQWLSLKNICPICRGTALATDGRDS